MSKYAPRPLIYADFPDPDVICVDKKYYMITTTMHMFPGGEILMSKDLMHWEFCSFVFDTLDKTNAQQLNGENIYGQGMWAATLREHNGVFHVLFVCNDTHSAYHFTAGDIHGPWTKHDIAGFYHDCSLLFDGDRVFLTHGNRQIRLTEMEKDLSKPREGGIDTVIVRDSDEIPLGYEGSHFYKINGKYVLFLIHWPNTGHKRRTQACFIADQPEGPYTGGDILDDDIGFFNQGVAQGGFIQGENGTGHALLFQDRGACGRVPVLCDVKWEKGRPVLTPSLLPPAATEEIAPLLPRATFREESLSPLFQFNHEPDRTHTYLTPRGLRIDAIPAADPEHARNTLTVRPIGPVCECSVTLDPSFLPEGGKAGLAALQGCFAALQAERKNGLLFLRTVERIGMPGKLRSDEKITLGEPHPLPEDPVRLMLRLNFEGLQDTADLYLISDKGPLPLLTAHRLFYRLDHFMGCRPALFCYGEKETDGCAFFSDFEMTIPTE